MNENIIRFKYFIIKIKKKTKRILKKFNNVFKPISNILNNAFEKVKNKLLIITGKFKTSSKKIMENNNIRRKNKKDIKNSQRIIKDNMKKDMKYKKMKKNRKKKKKKIGKIIGKILIFIISIIILCIIAFGIYIAVSAPKFDPDNLNKNNGTLIYDRKGELITVIGNEKRQKVKYEDLPQVLIDAIISTEDANFFEHKGVDLKRLIKATYYQARGNSDAGGASTITMQLSKNSFTSTEATGIKGIIRKLTDIYMSVFYIERKYTKKELFEFYVNTPYLGSSSYGVEQASQTYFNKHVQDLNLVESATIAGLIQAPSAYDPYIYPEKIENRKNLVLSLMKKHGHISEKEYQEGLRTTVKSLLVDQRKESTTKYQGFIDTVVQEVIDRTGNNPYNVSMAIYTTLDKSKQDIINDFYEDYDFKDDLVEAGIGVIDNKTGEILAVGAGRDNSKEMTFNYATQINRHPGSTAKPIFDYGPGIEYIKWNTNKSFYDKPTRYSNGATLKNWDGKYMGYMTLKRALSESRNTCALQAFQENDNKQIIEFAQNLGINPEINNGYLGEWHSIGAFNGVNPVQLAGAYAAFGNEGNFNEPHSYTKIKYYENGKIEKNDYKKKKAMSAGTAYMIAFVLQDVTNYRVNVSGTEIATKTGTSSYDETLTRRMGLSSDIIQDSWTVTFSPDYTVSIWYGYNKLYKNHYNTMNSASYDRVVMQSMIVNRLMKKNSKFKIPDTVVKRYSGGTMHVFWKDGGYVDRGYIGEISSTKKKEAKPTKKQEQQPTTDDTEEEETTTIVEERDDTPVEEVVPENNQN